MRHTPTAHRHRIAPPAPRRAFTLMETAFATVIVGVGVLAIMEAHQAFMRKNAWSTHTSTAMFLANEIREMTRHMPRHDLFSGGIYFSDPIAQTGFQGWGPESGETHVSEYNDLDDFDGVALGNAPNLPGPLTNRFGGPVNSFGELITETDWGGNVVIDPNGEETPLAGWTQYIRVTKVHPRDYTQTLPNDHVIPPSGPDPGVAVDRFPLRLTVHVLYQGPFDTEATEITRMSWVAIPR